MFLLKNVIRFVYVQYKCARWAFGTRWYRYTMTFIRNHSKAQNDATSIRNAKNVIKFPNDRTLFHVSYHNRIP